MFMMCSGTRDERVTETMGKIGPAVVNGGMSTFLAFIFLFFSESYIFSVFCRVSQWFIIVDISCIHVSFLLVQVFVFLTISFSSF